MMRDKQKPSLHVLKRKLNEEIEIVGQCSGLDEYLDLD
jgi:hypothetical protein